MVGAPPRVYQGDAVNMKKLVGFDLRPLFSKGGAFPRNFEKLRDLERSPEAYREHVRPTENFTYRFSKVCTSLVQY